MMWAIFAIMGYVALTLGYWYTDLSFWMLVCWGFVTWVYILYDMRYQEIPDQILVPAIYMTLILLITTYLTENSDLFFDVYTYTGDHTFHTHIIDHISGAIILYTFFYLQILIPGSLYLIRKSRSREILSLLFSYFTFPFVILYELIVKPQSEENTEEIPVWIGWWDLRVALFIGLTLGTLHGVAAVAVSYIVGSIVWIFILILSHQKKDKSARQIAFGPFLGIGWIVSLLWYSDILDYIQNIL
jgi:prepilin signal peptidase PulO-like enzyme (type II secretory pathway)